MAVEEKIVPRHGPVLTGAYLVGLASVFVGQRLIGEPGLGRTLCDGIGVAICGGAVLVRLLGRSRVTPEAARVEGLTSLLYIIGLVALGLYALTTSWGLELLGQRETEGGELVSVVCGVLWFSILICALFPLIFIELSYATMPVAGAVELRRVHLSGASGLTLALALVYLFGINYAVTQFDVSRDLSYFRASSPSEATINMVKRLDEPIDVVLFYPTSNEVLDVVEPYFEQLRNHSKMVRIKRIDHVLAPRLASKNNVKGNGAVLVSRGDVGESFDVGLELEKARNRLKKLDRNFQEKFSAVTRPGQIFYTTVGHGERTTRSRDQVQNAGISDFANHVRRYGLRQRNLGLVQGLATKVPEDATVVAVIGPENDLLPEEVESLIQYVEDGGRLLLMLEPGNPAGLEPLLDALGLELEPGRLAHPQRFRLVTETRADQAVIITNSYISHPSVQTIRRSIQGSATVFSNAGHLRKRQIEKGGPQVNFVIRSLPGTWADLDGDLNFDPDEEQRNIHNIAAAIQLPAVKSSTRARTRDNTAGEASKRDRSEPREGRAFVIVDADVFSNGLIANEGNELLASDVMTWLSGNVAAQGELERYEDPEIQHTRNQNVIWFWSTVFLIPLVVLAFGLIFSARRRRREEGRS